MLNICLKLLPLVVELSQLAQAGFVLVLEESVMQDLQDRAVVTKLFDTLAPRFASRPGGYTRILKAGIRRGDATPMAIIQLV